MGLVREWVLTRVHGPLRIQAVCATLALQAPKSDANRLLR